MLLAIYNDNYITDLTITVNYYVILQEQPLLCKKQEKLVSRKNLLQIIIIIILFLPFVFQVSVGKLVLRYTLIIRNVPTMTLAD